MAQEESEESVAESDSGVDSDDSEEEVKVQHVDIK